MTRRNKFGIDLDQGIESGSSRRDRKPGPMGVAIRDTAQNLQTATEEKIEQRRRNAADAEKYRDALDAGHVLMSIPVHDINTDDLPRDRIDLQSVASSDEMDELKTSIRDRGQRDPIEIYEDSSGRYQLKSGWRRLNALRQLHDETGEQSYALAVARLTLANEDRLTQYLDMAEENIIREDLTFAEMAQLAITAAADPALEETSADAVVGRLYKSVHKVKRSYIRSFVFLLEALGDDLKWPKAISRNVGLEIVRQLKSDPSAIEKLRNTLAAASSAEEQTRILEAFVAQVVPPKSSTANSTPKKKFEFHHDGLKVTARRGECRIVSDVDYTDIPKDRLENAISAFKAALGK